jgi:hypothetical protein
MDGSQPDADAIIGAIATRVHELIAAEATHTAAAAAAAAAAK